MKMMRTAMAAIACMALANPALAAGSCATEPEAMALRTAAVQQQLMVAAFMCQGKEDYNRFVQTYGRELRSSDAVLKSYFVRLSGRGGEVAYDAYKTRAANLSALEQARNDRAFCTLAGQLFAAALRSQAPLAAFVAAAPSAPGFTEVCIDRLQDNRNRVHMADAAQDPAGR
jgi:hypothetical protein